MDTNVALLCRDIISIEKNYVRELIVLLGHG